MDIKEKTSADSIASAFGKSVELFGDQKLEEIHGGNINYVFSTADDKKIIHICPNIFHESDVSNTVSAPHAVFNKSHILAQQSEHLTLPEGHNFIIVPNFYTSGSFSDNSSSYTYWIEQKISGDKLQDSFELLDVTTYEKIIQWIAELQSLNTNPNSQITLKDFYGHRLDSFKTFFLQNKVIDPVLLIDIFKSFQDSIDNSVGINEVTSYVHGDLNATNILIDKDEDTLNTIGIIDFEKSVYRGDALIDPLKLLALKHEYITPNLAYSYVPNLSGEDKLGLLGEFLKVRYDSKLLDTELIISNIFERDFLSHLDTILSVLAYRMLNNNSKLDNEKPLIEYLKEYYLTAKLSGAIR